VATVLATVASSDGSGTAGGPRKSGPSGHPRTHVFGVCPVQVRVQATGWRFESSHPHRRKALPATVCLISALLNRRSDIDRGGGSSTETTHSHRHREAPPGSQVRQCTSGSRHGLKRLKTRRAAALMPGEPAGAAGDCVGGNAGRWPASAHDRSRLLSCRRDGGDAAARLSQIRRPSGAVPRRSSSADPSR
jgi:hypothetical protein